MSLSCFHLSRSRRRRAIKEFPRSLATNRFISFSPITGNFQFSFVISSVETLSSLASIVLDRFSFSFGETSRSATEYHLTGLDRAFRC